MAAAAAVAAIAQQMVVFLYHSCSTIYGRNNMAKHRRRSLVCYTPNSFKCRVDIRTVRQACCVSSLPLSEGVASAFRRRCSWMPLFCRLCECRLRQWFWFWFWTKIAWPAILPRYTAWFPILFDGGDYNGITGCCPHFNRLMFRFRLTYIRSGGE